MTTLALAIRPEDPGDVGAIERLHERAFGPGRFARTAFRLRERTPSASDLCFSAFVGTLLVGSVRMSPILAGEEPGHVLGPLAVEPAFAGRGIGAALIERALEAARERRCGMVLLVGDESYYGRFGFARAPTGLFDMPAPVDPARVLVAELRPGALGRAGGRVIGSPS